MADTSVYQSRILIVDDDPDNLLLLEDDLHGIAAKIDTASSGQEALDLADQHSYALILMDFNMPALDGAETTIRLDSSTFNKRTPVIFVTDATDEETTKRAYEAGGVDYLLKGSKPDIMKAKIDVFLELDQKNHELKQALHTIKESAASIGHHRDHLQAMVEKRTAALEIAKNQAESASRAKSDFLSKMSHELRTPINGILGISQVLHDTDMDEMQSNYLDVIHHSAEMLLDSIGDIIEVSELEAGLIELKDEPFDLIKVLNQLLGVSKALVAGRHIDIHLDFPADLSPWQRGDANRIRQVLMVFIQNAARHTEHGDITLRVSNQALEDDANLVRFEVVDTGEGIPDEKLGVIFEKFTQANDGFTRKIGGLGLGLAKAFELARLMNGEVDARSSVGKGSTFSLELPLHSVDAPADAAEQTKSGGKLKAAAEHSSPASNRVLLAEDNPINQMVARKVLENLGYEVELAQNGSEAVDKYEGDRFSVVLMDLHMPEMDGLEAIQLIRQIEGGTGVHIPVIVLTADTLQKTQDACLAAGANEYLTKPLKVPALKSALARLLPETPRAAVH